MSSEKTLIYRDAKVPQMHHLCGLDVDVMYGNFSLAFSLHRESVEDSLWRLGDIEDHDLIDDVSGGVDVQVLVTDRLCHRDGLTIIVVANLSSLVASIVVVLAIVKI